MAGVKVNEKKIGGKENQAQFRSFIVKRRTYITRISILQGLIRPLFILQYSVDNLLRDHVMATLLLQSARSFVYVFCFTLTDKIFPRNTITFFN